METERLLLLVSEQVRRELSDRGYDLVELIESYTPAKGEIELRAAERSHGTSEGVRAKATPLEVLAIGVSIYVVARGIAAIIREALRTPDRLTVKTLTYRPALDSEGNIVTDAKGETVYEFREDAELLEIHEESESEQMKARLSATDGLSIELK